MELCRLAVTGSQTNSTRHAPLLQSRFGNYTIYPWQVTQESRHTHKEKSASMKMSRP